MSRGTDFHSTEVMLVHDGSTVTLTQYGTLKDANLATIDADISGSNVRLKVTLASATSTVIKFDRTLVEGTKRKHFVLERHFGVLFFMWVLEKHK